MSRRGVSIEEKRTRLLSSLYDKKECFNLKEIEKLGKKCGIIEQTVKDILQSLVDDSLVMSDKVGSLNIFWALPSAARSMRENRINYLRATKQEIEDNIQSLNNLIEESSKTDTEETKLRKKKMERLEELTSTNEELTKKLQHIKMMLQDNPKVLQEQINQSNEAILRWEDNICNIRQWIKKKMPGVKEREINQNFGLPNED
ncbi:Mnd1 family protein [Cryptosporidium muris RN66]|uniref:Mnd1 family protein n=1 Tax=Cryptosporidium muris (strain RN66) TaxID=441375 RepID=B6AGP2_CRYMR|nr:Mnd1 family protein [Cryptosporidium muris RN66]EEA07383.1 Mnd1 family protein [Cryptosporidium muris RN66]|eukprot:XP_002141732.1 Mnd1 family protein [Cryptosporidium muris RN66]